MHDPPEWNHESLQALEPMYALVCGSEVVRVADRIFEDLEFFELCFETASCLHEPFLPASMSRLAGIKAK
jgi:hypothetical protein